MDSREIALAVKEKERKNKEKQTRQRTKELERRQKLESSRNRVIIRDEPDGETMTVKPRPLYRYFTKLGMDSFWFICITAIAVPIVAASFGSGFLKPFIPYSLVRIGVSILASLFGILVFFLAYTLIKKPTLHLKATSQGHFALSSFNKDKPLELGELDELTIRTSGPDKTTGWGEASINTPEKTYEFNELKPKDIGRIEAFRKRHKVGGY